MGLTKLFSGLSKHTDHNHHHHPTTPSSSHTTSNVQASPLDKYHTPHCNVSKPNAPLRIAIKIESPPLVLFGPVAECTGALFSGALVVDILPSDEPPLTSSSSQAPVTGPAMGSSSLDSDAELAAIASTMSISRLSQQQLTHDYVQIKKVQLALIQIVEYGKPFLTNSSTLCSCPNCTTKITELARWDVLTKPTAFAKGTNHGYPFTHLVPGDLPPTSVLSNHHTSIRYELVCITDYITTGTHTTDTINLALPIMIRRSILRGPDRNSLRVFPPTSVTATAVVPNVTYPKSTFPVEIRMDNVSNKDRRWRMRKLNWRIEESCKVMVQHCDEHNLKFETTVANLKKSQREVNINNKFNDNNSRCLVSPLKPTSLLVNHEFLQN
ncbi:unnamed protein product [Ambrosiozyma monospora]|uniref:Unnamed protein product n=1 Tax=Ambrosiozyma monospora TaxID=43982 RepID=A0ACB5T4E2_AMBMO|nr:unnamed protein product [Ambrosiozyma monospora]